MNKLPISILLAAGVALSGANLSLAQDGTDVPDLRPIEIQLCSYHDRKDSDDYDDAMAKMREWMDDNDAQPYAAWRLYPLFAGRQDFDFVYIGAWSDGASMGKDIAQYRATAGDAIEAADDVVDCNDSSMFTSLNIKALEGDGTGDFILTVTDCTIADGRSAGDVIDALVEYGEYRNASGSPGGTWIWFPSYSAGDEDFSFKLANSFAGLEAFGNHFKWNRDNQAYLKRRDLFSGLMSCNTARAYTGDTIVNTLPTT